MNYPLWQIPGVGGGLLIAIIAVLHVYISHLAVGGGLFLVWTERKARRENDAGLLDYVRRHTWFFLLLTMVFGGITGVGIWFIISLVSPAGTSSLIHSFVFGWAIEWTFFVGEIVALLLYHYLFDRLRPSLHMAMGWLYFAFAWLSLFIINGILSYMLTPGRWLETQGFWDGFFNPGYWPSLLFRTAIAFTIAGLFGLLTALREPDADLRQRLLRYCSRWILLPFVGLVLGGLWYWNTVPAEAQENLLLRNPSAMPWLRLLAMASVLLFLGGALLLLRLPRGLRRATVVLLVVVGLGWMAGFEYVREIARKPWVISGHLYSNGVSPRQQALLDQEGFLAHARWVGVREVDAGDPVPAGRELFVHQCHACHTVGGMNDILALTAEFPEEGLIAQLGALGSLSPYMPPFFGTDEEKAALAAYLARELHGRPAPSAPERAVPPADEVAPAPFDPDSAEYLLLVWNDLGMHCLTDADAWLSILPPANTLWAQLIRRGETPERVVEGVTLRYRVEEGYEHPERHVDFWDHVDENYGVALEPGVGLAGREVVGRFGLDADLEAWVAPAVPVVPYPEDGSFRPYPLFRVEAVDEATEEVIATALVVAPVSSEMSCRRCHGGEPRHATGVGLSEETARNILKAHDRRSRTELLAEAEAGRPRACSRCHADPAVSAAGDPSLLSLSAAVHGFHAHLMGGRAEDACGMCHPADPDGVTRCFRGRHSDSLVCVDCHGSLEDHALSLLKGEDAPGAARLREHLIPQVAESVEAIEPRQPWIQEPDCLSCHPDFSLEGDSAFNQWTADGAALYRNRADDMGVMCAGCHGSPHAIYPAVGDRNNLVPLQLQGVAATVGTERGCPICHTVDMGDEGHHENMVPR